MLKKKAILPLIMCSLIAMCSCSVDVNSIASKMSSSESSEVQTDSDSDSSMFYTSSVMTDTDTNTDTSTETQTDTQTDVQAFDESKYLTMFVSGAAEISLTADAIYGSTEVGSLKSGDRVSVVQRGVQEFCFVYSPTLEKFGYVRTEYLADYLEETTIGETYYVLPAQASVYSDVQQTTALEDVSMNDMLTVIVKRTGGIWRVADNKGNIGYIDSSLLSEKKIKVESSKKSDKSSKNKSSKSDKSSKTEASSSESKSTSSSETSARVESSSSAVSSEEEAVSGLYTGVGEPPENYTTYIVDVDVGYLSLRDRPSADKSKTIGKLYLDERVYMLDSSGDFWYIYAPSLGMYGYVTGNLNYLYPEYYDD